MLIRTNPCYPAQFVRTRRLGMLLITKRWIIATGNYARAWAN